MTSKKMIVGVVVILALVAAFFIFSVGRVGYQSNEDAALNGGLPETPGMPDGRPTAEDLTPQNEFVVRYTSQGFVPADIEIAPGQTIIFVNDSQSGMWVASNPHPTH